MMDEVKSYIVTVPYRGKCDFVVDAVSVSEAKAKAAQHYVNKEFGNALGMTMEQNIDLDAFDLIEPKLIESED